MTTTASPIPGMARAMTETFLSFSFEGEDFQEIASAAEAVFAGNDNPKARIEALEGFLKEHTLVVGALSEYYYDLLMLKLIFDGGVKDDQDYFVSPEWEEVEEMTADRGTELINFLIYLGDCLATGNKPTVDDFLNEFLLVEDEDDFQEDFFVYEPLIANQALVEAPLPDVFEVAAQISGGELDEIFAPILLFFRNYRKSGDKIFELIGEKSANPALDAGLLRLLLAFWRSAPEAE